MAAALGSPSLIPSSLYFSGDGPPSLSSSSSSLSFSVGGTKRSYLSVSSSSSSPNGRRGISGRRSVVVVCAASGDYYATLGVPKSANIKEIKSAYRRLARQVHSLYFIPHSLELGLTYLYLIESIYSIIPMWTRNLAQPTSSRKSVLPMRYVCPLSLSLHTSFSFS